MFFSHKKWNAPPLLRQKPDHNIRKYKCFMLLETSLHFSPLRCLFLFFFCLFVCLFSQWKCKVHTVFFLCNLHTEAYIDDIYDDYPLDTELKEALPLTACSLKLWVLQSKLSTGEKSSLQSLVLFYDLKLLLPK